MRVLENQIQRQISTYLSINQPSKLMRYYQPFYYPTPTVMNNSLIFDINNTQLQPKILDFWQCPAASDIYSAEIVKFFKPTSILTYESNESYDTEQGCSSLSIFMGGTGESARTSNTYLMYKSSTAEAKFFFPGVGTKEVAGNFLYPVDALFGYNKSVIQSEVLHLLKQYMDPLIKYYDCNNKQRPTIELVGSSRGACIVLEIINELKNWNSDIENVNINIVLNDPIPGSTLLSSAWDFSLCYVGENERATPEFAVTIPSVVNRGLIIRGRSDPRSLYEGLNLKLESPTTEVIEKNFANAHTPLCKHPSQFQTIATAVLENVKWWESGCPELQNFSDNPYPYYEELEQKIKAQSRFANKHYFSIDNDLTPVGRLMANFFTVTR